MDSDWHRRDTGWWAARARAAGRSGKGSSASPPCSGCPRGAAAASPTMMRGDLVGGDLEETWWRTQRPPAAVPLRQTAPRQRQLLLPLAAWQRQRLQTLPLGHVSARLGRAVPISAETSPATREALPQRPASGEPSWALAFPSGEPSPSSLSFRSGERPFRSGPASGEWRGQPPPHHPFVS